MQPKLQASNVSFPAGNFILSFLRPKSQKHISLSSEFCLIAKLLESKVANNKSCPDRSPFKSICPDFDLDNNKFFQEVQEM